MESPIILSFGWLAAERDMLFQTDGPQSTSF